VRKAVIAFLTAGALAAACRADVNSTDQLPGHSRVWRAGGPRLVSNTAVLEQDVHSGSSGLSGERAFPKSMARSMPGSMGRILDPGPAIPSDDADRDTPQANPLAPGPGSAALFLAGMASFGVMKLGQKPRGLHLANLPDWYHTGAPAQIGHVGVFDFEFSPLAVCVLHAPAHEQRLRLHRQRELPSRCEAQSFLLVGSPRAPPGLSC